jgi:two-component system NtrC family sensor kinase
MPNILIVDDSITVRMDLADAFGAAGFRPLPRGSLGEARRTLAEETIDLVILDVVLPDGDGIELLRELRGGPAPSTPVMMLSTEAEIHDRIRGLKTGANDYVGKPYDVGYVIATARRLLQAQAEHESLHPVLLIDDSPTFRAELGGALARAGYSVLTAASGEEGLRIAANERPDAIIVDGVLPGIDGAAVVRRVRLDAALRGVPCILLTATDAVGEELRALDSGADAFVHKGEDPALILARLHAALRAAGERKRDSETASLLGPKRILAVDDSATYREEVAAALRNEGYEVIAAHSGEEAIELLSVQSVDCILLDLLMPGIGGKETCRRIKNSPVVRDIPVLMLTAVDDRTSMLEGLALGADDYIEKSAAFDVLKARVRAQLRRRQFEDETRRVREQLLRSELETAEARAAHELAETRARLVEELEQKNQALHDLASTKAALAERFQAANEELRSAYSELQAAQAQLVQSAKMASLGQLVAGVAHEINNPLAFVLGHLNTTQTSLQRVHERIEPLPPGADEQWQRANSRLKEIGLGLERIRDLVVKLRTFSRLDEGEQKRASIRECVESVLIILKHRLKNRISIETELGEPDLVDCFPGLLNQALMNLMSNAIDAIADQGNISISSGADGDFYRIAIADSGSGISPDIRDRVCEPFFTTKPVGQGTGLGLSITYSIIRKHQGTLELREREGGGTLAVVRFPLKLEETARDPH